MVSHQRAVEIIRDTIERDERVPDEMSYIIHEPDTEGRDSGTSLPLVQMEIQSVDNDDLNNSTFAGYIYDDDGREVGRRYERRWEMNLSVYLWTVESSQYDVQRLGEVVKTVLYDYDELGPSEPFVTDEGEVVENIWGFQIQQSQREDDFGQTPTLRRLRIDTLVRGANEYRQTGEEPVLVTEEGVEVTLSAENEDIQNDTK